MPVRIAGSGRSHGDPGPDRVDEALACGRPAAVVGDLEQIDTRQAGGQQAWIDLLLEVAHQQEPTPSHVAEEDDGDVVDPFAAVERPVRHLPGDRPQDAQSDLIDRHPVTGCETKADQGRTQRGQTDPSGITGARSTHPGL